MTYRVLARKWRPATFAELVGQTHVLRALQNALQQGRIHHAYLLTGTRGVGKTTIARILARCFNCEEGVSASPCGVCSSCVEIAEGRSLDLIEVDAASRTKVEDTRELLENSQFAPSHGRYKIYLIDEVHMLSNHSFNALLKTLEEPPEHVIFIFATTHPQKIPVTVLSRCLQFHLKNISNDLISQHLSHVLEEEKIEVDQKSLSLIAHAAQGSMRDALSITEQAIAFGEGSISFEQVNDMLGVVDHQIALRILESVVKGNVEQVLALLAEFAAQTADFSLLLDSIMQLLHRVSLEQLLKGVGTQGQLYAEGIEQLAGTIDPTLVQIYYQALLNGKRDLSYAPDPLTGTEMILARMVGFRPLGEQLKPETLAPAAATGAATENAPQKVTEKTASEPIGGNQVKKHEASASDANQLSSDQATAVKAETETRVDDQLAPFEDLAAFTNESWCNQFFSMPLSGLVRAVAEHCSWKSVVDNRIELVISKDQAALYNQDHDARIAKSLSIYFGSPVSVRVSMQTPGDTSLLTPAVVRQTREQEKQADAVSAIENDEVVQKIMQTFDATIEYESVRPIN